jgi:hypothetical protein
VLDLLFASSAQFLEIDMKSFTVYRVPNSSYVTYKPVVRKGKPVTFKLKVDAENWLLANPYKGTARPAPTFEVRRTIKEMK